MRAQGLFNATAEAMSSLQLHWLEVLDVRWVEEHIPNRGFLLVHAQRIACEHDSLQDDLHGVRRNANTRRNDCRAVARLEGGLGKADHFARLEHNWTVNCGNRLLVGFLVQEARIFPFLSVCSRICFLSKYRLAIKPSETAVELHELFGWHYFFILNCSSDFERHC